ncbi:hypothetical protein GJ699_31915 [Duganella sp. FT80W]|uniref:Uncharacterized protein n=1 Tax=Duganella guangzhouensis TaxID=2666084 RepID=A0A6I2LCN6_9BURK|nr:hypothetical protein [Duganella guangzhouensis]MRW94584.1 hypothetical protein [Duganella guangzhouensis]
MTRKLAVLSLLSVFPSIALAHGEEVLVPIMLQLLSVIVTVLSLCIVRRFRPYFIGGVLMCVAGVIASWFITGPLPFFENQLLITLVDVICPPAATAIFLAWALRREVRG